MGYTLIHKMELPHIGEHCTFKTCNKLDYLPFKCVKCQITFCEEHYKPSQHNCSKHGEEKSVAMKVKKKKKKSNPCEMVDCRGFNLVPMLCGDCGLNFCIKHRFAADHECLGRFTSR